MPNMPNQTKKNVPVEKHNDDSSLSWSTWGFATLSVSVLATLVMFYFKKPDPIKVVRNRRIKKDKTTQSNNPDIKVITNQFKNFHISSKLTPLSKMLNASLDDINSKYLQFYWECISADDSSKKIYLESKGTITNQIAFIGTVFEKLKDYNIYSDNVKAEKVYTILKYLNMTTKVLFFLPLIKLRNEYMEILLQNYPQLKKVDNSEFILLENNFKDISLELELDNAPTLLM